MYENHGWKIALSVLILLGFATAFFVFPLQLGLDLQGGSNIIYEIDPFRIFPEDKRTSETTDAVIQVLQNRLDALGLKELEIRRYGRWGIEVQLPGYSAEETQRIKDLIAQAGVLWFKLVAQNQDPDIIHQLQDLKERGLYPLIRNYDPNGPLPEVDWLGNRYGHDLAEDELARRYRDEMRGYVERHGTLVEQYDIATSHEAGERLLLLENHGAIPGGLLTGASVQRNPQYGVVVAFQFDADGGAMLSDLTRANVGRRFAIVLDGISQSAPVIREPITEGSGIIHGQFTIETAQDLVIVLQAGALPEGAEPREVSSLNVGPQLGRDSIRAGAICSIVALAAVVLFMIYYYGLVAGGIADIALVGNMVIVLGFLALFEATLTLPGIAGMVLTMGMAVDANILIYERMREEQRRGGGIKLAAQEGYARAFWTIFDSNITTILTAVVLYVVGTGPIKGFAVTLTVGIAASMFTALFVTRTVYGYIIERKILTKDLVFKQWIPENANYPFVSQFGKWIKISLACIAIGFVIWTIRGDAKYGIDFTGGNRVQVALAQPMSANELTGIVVGITREENGQTVHPYPEGEIEVQAAGATDALNRSRLFFVTSRVTGRTIGAPAAGAAPEDETHSVERFVQDIRQALGDRLAPTSFDPIGTGGAFYRVIDAAPPAPPAPPVGPPAPPVGPPAPPAAPGPEAPAAPPAGDHGMVLPPPGPGSPTQTPDEIELPPPTAPQASYVRLEIIANLLTEEGRPVDAASVEAYLRGIEREGAHPWSEVTVEDAPAAHAVEGVAKLRILSGVLQVGGEPVERVADRLMGDLQDIETGGFRTSAPFPTWDAIGDTIAHNLKTKAILAILLSCFIIIVYVTFRFEFMFGVAAVLALFHDVLITMGAIALIDLVLSPIIGINVKVDLSMIAAFLTVIGYSLNDTIVVCDRIRENLATRRVRKAKEPEEEMKEVINESINQTLSRTTLTSGTTLLTVVILLFSGVSTIEGFAAAMTIGIVTGTYSSIFIAAPIIITRPRKMLAVVGGMVGFIAAVTLIGALVLH